MLGEKSEKCLIINKTYFSALIQLEIGVRPKLRDPHVAAALLKQW